MKKLFLLLLIVLTLSCSKDSGPESNCYSKNNPPRNSHKVAIRQGVWGDIWFWNGNFMPPGRGEICQIKRTVYVHELTALSDVEQIGNTSFYTAINTNLVAIAESDSEGFFEIELEPGSYSLFVKEEDKFYANFFNSEGIIAPVTIELDKVSEVKLNITYKATF